MKLHLPKKLTAALLAACAALALNTTAAAASTGTASFTGGQLSYEEGDQVLTGLYLTKDMTTGTATANKLTDLANTVDISNVSNDCRAVDYTVSIWVTADSLESNCLLFSYGGTVATSGTYGANGIYWDAATSTLKFGRGKIIDNYTNMAWQENVVSSSLASAIGSGDMVNFTISVACATQSAIPTIWVNGEKQATLNTYKGNMDGFKSPMDLYAGTGITYGDISLTNEQLTSAAQIYSLMGVSAAAPGTEKHFVWTGTEGSAWDTETANWVTTTAPEDPTTFESGAANTVTFGTEPSQEEVALSTTASVASVTVNDSYTLSIANGGSLTTGELNITAGETAIAGEGSLTAALLALGDNSSLKLSGTGAVSLGSITFGTGSALKIARSLDLGTMALKSATTPAIQVQDGGVLSLNTASTIDGAIVGKAAETTTQGFRKMFTGAAIGTEGTGKVVWNGSANVYDNGTATGATYQLGNGDVKIVGDVKVNASTREVTWAVSGDKSLEVTGNYWMSNKQYASVDDATLTVGGNLKLAHEANNGAGGYLAKFTATNGAEVTLGGIEFVGGGNIVSIDGSTLSFTKADGNVLSHTGSAVTTANTVTLNNAKLGAWNHGWTLAAMDGDDLTTVTVTGTTNLSVAGGCEIDLTASSINGTFKMTGGGTASISGVGSLTDTVDSGQYGTIVLNGTYEIGGITPTGDETTYTGGKNVRNGYETARGQIVAYTGNIEDHASYTYHGESVTLTEGAYSLPGVMDPTTFYINELSESYSWIDEKKTEDFSGIVVKQAGTLVVDKAMDLSVVAEASTGNVQIESGIVATGTSDGHVTLTGSGIYALNDGTVALGNVTLGSEWTGTVRIHDAAVNNVDFKTLVNGTASTLELMGYSGYPMAWYEQVEGGLNPQNIKLTNGSDGYAFKYTGSTSYDNHVVTFSGNWSGDGTMQTAGNHLNYKFTGDISDWKGKLQVASGIPHVTFSGDATEVNAIIDKNGKTLDLIVGEGDEFSTTFKATVDATSLTVSENAEATLEADATIGSVTSSGYLTMAEGTTVTLSNNLTPMSDRVAVYGTLNVSNDIDLSKNGASTGTLSLKGGSETTAAGLWMASSARLEIDSDAVLNIAGLHIVGDGGTITTEADNEEYSADNANFTITCATVTATTDVTIGNSLYDVDVETGAHTVTLNSDAASVIVSDGGTFTLGSEVVVANGITVEDGGTIAGGVDAKEVGIAAESTATFAQGIQDASGVTFSKEGGVQVENTNVGGPAIKYGIDVAAASVTADELQVSGELVNDIVVNNKLHVASIVNNSDKALTLTKVDEDALKVVSTDSADLTIKGITETSLTDLSIGTGATVAVYTDEHAATEGTVTITDTLTAGGAKLLANLEMVNGSKLDVNGGGVMALTLGSQFTIADNALVTLDEATLAAIAGLVNIGDKVILINQYEDHALTTNLTDGDWSRTHFDLSSITNADYKLYVQDGQIGLVKSSNVPEPTTGTLSLLALMALAARRRRK